MKTIRKRKILIVKADLLPGTGYVPFDIPLPANVKKVTGIMVTAIQKFGG